MSSKYNKFKHDKFWNLFLELINDAQTQEEKHRLFTVFDYINHLRIRIKRLEGENISWI